MSIEDAIIAQSRPHIVSRKLNHQLSLEVAKGCLAEINRFPVEIEPVFDPSVGLNDYTRNSDILIANSIDKKQFVRLNICISPNQKSDWNRSELMNKQLSSVSHRIIMNISGNSKMINLSFLCHRNDVPIIKAAFQGQFEECMLYHGSLSLIPSDFNRLAFNDFFPRPPYHYLFTGPQELQRSPYSILINVLKDFPPNTYGLYQVVFQPVNAENNWHENIRQLLDIEFRIKSQNGVNDLLKLSALIPSGSLTHMANDMESKAHNDKPFFAVAFRIAVFSNNVDPHKYLKPLASISRLFQHGRKPLQFITEQEYNKYLKSPEVLKNIFEYGTTYRSGFLLNSEEMTSLVHIPSPGVIEPFENVISMLEPLTVNESNPDGTLLGYINDPVQQSPVYLPNILKSCHTHLIGKPGSGKSHQMLIMTLDDINRGDGVFVIDPHGTLIESILEHLSPEHADRVIYLNPGDYNNAIQWNPLQSDGLPYDKVANNIVSSFKSFVPGWGPRLEHIFRETVIGAIHLPGGNLMDVSVLLESKSPQSLALQKRIISLLDNDYHRNFWEVALSGYAPSDIAPVKHKISTIMSFLPVQRMFSQRRSAIDLNGIIETNKIVLLDLSDLVSEVKKVLGSFVLAMIHLAALGRKDLNKYSHFHIYCDEAHNFMTDAMEEMIAETRKFKVPLILAHQYLKQYTPEKIHALSTVGTQIIFQVNEGDAIYLKKGLLGKVDAIDLMSLKKGQAIARIDNQVVRYNTIYPLEKPTNNCRDQVISDSYKKYYIPVNELNNTPSDLKDKNVTKIHKGYADFANHDNVELAEYLRTIQTEGLPDYDTFD